MPSPARPVKKRASRPARSRVNGDMRCDAAFRQIAGSCLDDVARHHKAASTGNTTAIHQTRVALTRLRATIAFFSPMVDDAEWVHLKTELKWLNQYLGATRDLDVAIENCTTAAEKRSFKTAREDSQVRLAIALKSARYRLWFKDLVEWVANGPWAAAPEPGLARRRAAKAATYHADRLARWHEKLVKQGRGLRGMGKHKRHRLRLASKRLRYAIEFSDGALPKADALQWRRTEKHLRKGQQILGELNDAAIRRTLVAGLEQPPKAGWKPLDPKRKKRLLQRAATVYRKIAD